MKKVEVRFFAALRETVGKKLETIEFSDSEEVNVQKILDYLTDLYGQDFVDYVFDRKTGEIEDFLTFMVNGKSITTLQGMETKVKDGDVLAILPPVGGG